MDFLNLEENKLDYKKSHLWRKDFSENSNTKFSWVGWNEESSRTTSWRILGTKIKRKSWNNTETHFTIAVYARTNEFYERFRIISRSRIKLQWKEVIPSCSSLLSHDKPLPFDTWSSPGLQENVVGNQFSTFGSLVNHSQGFIMVRHQVLSHMKHEERENQFHEQ